MKKLRSLALAAALLLTACSQAAPEAQLSSRSAGTLEITDAAALTVEPDKIYADIDAAYSAGYRKIGLPERDTVEDQPPEGVYMLELEPVNKSLDEDWKARKGRELEPLFTGGSDDKKIKAAKCSAAYMLDNGLKAGAVTPLNADSIVSFEVFPLGAGQLTDERLSAAVSITGELGRQAKDILGDELDSIPYEAEIYHADSADGFGVQIAKAYKGVPILPYTPVHPTEEYTAPDSEVFPLHGYCWFDGQVRTVLYHPDDSYRAVRADRIEKLISFKAACDLLEENLGDAAHYDFDRAALMYDPRADTSSGEEFPNIKCRPKWYFITYADDYFCCGMSCITVDCIDGTVDVVM